MPSLLNNWTNPDSEPAPHTGAGSISYDTMEPFRIILRAEETFAREVALGVVVTHPLNNWLYLIPGMFIVDFLKRQTAIRRYVTDYMAPRHLAIDGNRAILKGGDPDTVRADIESQIGVWLATRGHRHPDLIEVQMTIVELLLSHFSKLLSAPVPDYHQMVRWAYADQEELRQTLNSLNTLESQRDRLLNATRDLDHINLEVTQHQVVMRRNRLLDAIY